MAKGSIFGKLSGKIGNVVVFERNGVQVVRSNPKQKDPETPAQLAHRTKFSLINKGLSPLCKIINVGYRNSEKNYRKLVGEAYHNAVIGEYPDFKLDYSRVQIAEGKLQLPANVAIKTEEGSNTVALSWDPIIAERSQPGRESDLVNIVCLNSDCLTEEHTYNAARRSEGKTTFELPVGWKLKDLNFWLFLSSYDLSENSNSMYLSIE